MAKINGNGDGAPSMTGQSLAEIGENVKHSVASEPEWGYDRFEKEEKRSLAFLAGHAAQQVSLTLDKIRRKSDEDEDEINEFAVVSEALKLSAAIEHYLRMLLDTVSTSMILVPGEPEPTESREWLAAEQPDPYGPVRSF